MSGVTDWFKKRKSKTIEKNSWPEATHGWPAVYPQRTHEHINGRADRTPDHSAHASCTSKN